MDDLGWTDEDEAMKYFNQHLLQYITKQSRVMAGSRVKGYG
jgi:hypothetical protein